MIAKFLCGDTSTIFIVWILVVVVNKGYPLFLFLRSERP
jgi:hypothetical protein